ncbi:MAG: helix-turn-helix transcriptional regulator [Reichenbachiella sp.]|uniref:helix-turn-helix domain-containing protein n=1 Tax=Reichenbachiella sp. TaxID=2184521 RepID=UPI003296C763
MHNIRDEEILNQLAKTFKKLRKGTGITQQELADKSGISISQIARIETGKFNSTVCTLTLLAKSKNVRPYELLIELG